MKDTHYILPLTERNGRFQLSACNIWVREDEHSTEPTCATCAKYLIEDSRELSVEDVFGTFDPSTVVKHKPFDPCSDYAERRR
jgi:hypothetical protein